MLEFVNADDIARGLSAFNVEAAAIAAGRIMLARLRELARQRVSFAFETTLSSRTRQGGHSVPPETIRRRYHGGVRNFFELYRPIATTWAVFDSSERDPKLIAEGEQGRPSGVLDQRKWLSIAGASDAE